jgi:hypothetical protein
VTFVEWEGEAPITVRWRLPQPLPDRLIAEFNVASSEESPDSRNG